MPTLQRWSALWQALELPESPARVALYAELMACYAEPHRHYHATQHLDECMAHLDALRDVAPRPAEVELALWFHDAIYDTRRNDNEQRSADWAGAALMDAGLDPAAVARVHTLILCTRYAAPQTDADAQVLMDVDLAILGSLPARFAECESQIRAEYAWVSEPIFRQKRRDILELFLSLPSIYATERYRARYEAQARSNLRESIARLS